MVAVRVRDDRAVHRPPRIDVEVARLAVQAAVGDAKEQEMNAG
jgi:hypothetical protein